MFTSIVIVIVVIYVFGYAGMIIYDLFLKKEPVEFMPKPKDVDIDISDEAGQFKPITVGKDEYRHQPAAIQHSTDYKPDEGIATAQPHTDGQEKKTVRYRSHRPPQQSGQKPPLPLRSQMHLSSLIMPSKKVNNPMTLSRVQLTQRPKTHQ